MANMAEGQSPSNARLVEAIYERDRAAVEAALAAGADIEARTFGGGSPALLAAKIDAWDICLLLLRRGASSKVASQTGMTIAEMASSSRIAPDSKEGRALVEVRQIIGARAR